MATWLDLVVGLAILATVVFLSHRVDKTLRMLRQFYDRANELESEDRYE